MFIDVERIVGPLNPKDGHRTEYDERLQHAWQRHYPKGYAAWVAWRPMRHKLVAHIGPATDILPTLPTENVVWAKGQSQYASLFHLISKMPASELNGYKVEGKTGKDFLEDINSITSSLLFTLEKELVPYGGISHGDGVPHPVEKVAVTALEALMKETPDIGAWIRR